MPMPNQRPTSGAVDHVIAVLHHYHGAAAVPHIIASGTERYGAMRMMQAMLELESNAVIAETLHGYVFLVRAPPIDDDHNIVSHLDDGDDDASVHRVSNINNVGRGASESTARDPVAVDDAADGAI